MLFAFLLIDLRLPVLKIDVASSHIYIVGDVPGNRRDIAVPRPYGRVGMAVVAGAFQNRLHFLGHLHVRFKTARRDYRRVRSAGLDNLDEEQNRNQASHNPFRRDTFHGRVSPKNFNIKIAGAILRRTFGKFAGGCGFEARGIRELREFETQQLWLGIRLQPARMYEQSSGNEGYYSIVRAGL